jgi:hypothetical protein
VTERVCSGGPPLDDRLLPPSITYGTDAITVTFLARRLVGGHECLGDPNFRVVVELREPIGQRRLLDGAFFPPFDPTAPVS